MQREVDIAIVGAGPVGAALALLLKASGFSGLLLEARAGAATDGRTLALSHGSRLVLEACNGWPGESATTPIDSIHVSQRGAFGRTVLTAAESEVPALGYVIPYAALQASMDAQLATAPWPVVRSAVVNDIALDPANIRIGFQHEGAQESINARLLVLADGGANVSKIPGIEMEEKDYGQTALVGQVETDLGHQGVAWERFTPEGPAALLPKGAANKGLYSLVWTSDPETVKELLALDDASFLKRLSLHLGERAGRFLSIGKRASFPLRLRVATPRIAERVAVIGAAAQTLHPVAGQGFNMGLRDAADLARVLQTQGAADPGAQAVLSHFAQARAQDTRMGVRFTDTLVGLFSTANPAITLGRGLGLAALDLLPPVRRALARRMIYGA